MNFFLGIDADGTARGRLRGHDRAHRGQPSGVGHDDDSGRRATWHHAAATYDGTTWRLVPRRRARQDGGGRRVHPRFDSIQHAAIGSALNSTGAAAGILRRRHRRGAHLGPRADAGRDPGRMSTSRSPAARTWWRGGASTRAAGTAVGDSTASPVHGTIIGTDLPWAAGAPFDLTFNRRPTRPCSSRPPTARPASRTSPTLDVAVADPDGEPLTVTFYGRAVPAGAAPDFTLVALPDTQHYSDDATRAATFTAQTQWIVNNHAAAEHPVRHPPGRHRRAHRRRPVEWTRANTSMSCSTGRCRTASRRATTT